MASKRCTHDVIIAQRNQTLQQAAQRMRDFHTPNGSTEASSGDTQRGVVPKGCMMDGFGELASTSCGVSLRELAPLTALDVRTENSVYRIEVVEPRTGDLLVRGGRFIPVQAKARLQGSSFGGSFIKLGSILCGMRMELVTNGRRIMTSPVRRIDIKEDAALPGPF